MKEKVLMIILDAFSSSYLKKEFCPNIYEIAQEHHYRKLEYMFGFQGVGAAIYSGATPNKTGVFTEFVLKPNDIADSTILQSLLRLSDIIPDETLCADLRYLTFRMFGKRRPGIVNIIPSRLLRYFSPKLTKRFSEENSLGHVPTIFDVLRVNGMSYELLSPMPRYENAVMSNTAVRIEKKKMPQFAVVHVCSLDMIGHKFGPSSYKVANAVARLDMMVGRILHSVKVSKEKIVTIILSDHGMSPASQNINLFKILNRLPLKIERDYLVFLDSTMARFWFFNKNARNLITETLQALDSGQILDKRDSQKLYIDNIGKEYGQLIFALREGHTIFPDFFRKSHPPKGMHGYTFPVYDNPVFMMYSPNWAVDFKFESSVRYVDIAPTVLDLLDAEIPNTCEGESLLT